MSNRPEEQDAVYTTIVGGRPPGCGTKVGNVPRGIEILVKKASVDPAFKQRLITDRTEAANDIELELNPAEAMMLQAIPAAQLETIISQTTVPEQQKSAFLGKIAATMLLALGIGLSGCSDTPVKSASKGVQPDRPKKSAVKKADDPKPDGEGDDKAANEKPSTNDRSGQDGAIEKPDRIPMTKGSRPDSPKF